MDKKKLARKAVKAAMELRRELEISPTEGVCPFDIARQLNISARMVNLPSLEGMYSPEPTPAIVVSSNRPHGRVRYTCAHEIGHHYFNHGFKIDELGKGNSESDSEEEFLAQRFGAALLMPQLTINKIFTRKKWKIPIATKEQFYIVAQELGVGYSTLILHISTSTSLLPFEQAEQLKKTSLKKIRENIAGFNIDKELYVLDEESARTIIDVELGDTIILPAGATVSNKNLEEVLTPSPHYIAIKPGVVEVTKDGAEKYKIRVGRVEFIGLAHFRYLEDEDEQ